ncbi:MAG: septum formation initiator family protein [Mycobacteriaceae bacterium]|nr:septum formation initiator family protein [Mycobacteriaceae bacterium]MBV9638849.1 septum formation initiator family protein [Mycobacteriaceae bacterium]
MPEGKRTESKRRSPAPRPGKPGDPSRGRQRSAQRREPRPPEPRPQPEAVTDSIGASIAAAAAHQSEQRLGSAARRAAILAAVVCVLTLTIAGPVRTYFAQRTEMRQLSASEAALRAQIADLEQQKAKLADPVFVAAQARERLGFVMPGDIPYQVQLPPDAAAPPQEPGTQAPKSGGNDPWYTSLWRTIADTPHNIAPTVVPGAPATNPPPPGPPPGA